MSKQLEYLEQVAVVQYLEVLKRQKKIVLFFAVINETSIRNVKYTAKLKAQGKRQGVTDLVIVFNKKVLFLEMKRKKRVLRNGKLSTEDLRSIAQKTFNRLINENSNSKCRVAYGFKEAKKIINKYVIKYGASNE